MPNYTTNYQFYKPNRNDDLEIDTSLADVMDKIDIAVKGVEDLVGKDDTKGVSKRTKDLETEVIDGRKKSDGSSFTSIGEHIRWVYDNAKGSGGSVIPSGIPRFIKQDSGGQSWEISVGVDGAITTTKISENPTMISQYMSKTVTITQSTTSLAYSFGFTTANTNYRISAVPSWNTNVWVTNKTTTGCTLNYASAPASASIDLIVFIQ